VSGDLKSLATADFCEKPDAAVKSVKSLYFIASPASRKFKKTGVISKEDTLNIYVGNLPLKVTEDELRREFTMFGEVISVKIMNDKYIGSGRDRWYGFVGMPSITEGESAVSNLNGKNLGGQAMEVIGALPLSAKQPAVALRRTKHLLNSSVVKPEQYWSSQSPRQALINKN
jgi:RNA recognition motif-containing protein